ncbi:MAG: response regulator [Peptostreptococcaceae bacterium]|jgi:YesN/AraC family two-component response regulator|nr:response regulator [Peptostreptococcaceae bacterium]
MKTNKILFVDDEVKVLNSIKRSLMDEEFETFYAVGGSDALRLLEEEKIDVIVSDMRMPRMTGLELLSKVEELYPDTVKIILSGYTELSQILTTVNKVNIFKYMTKPWDMENEFKPILKKAMEYYNLKTEKKELEEQLKKRNDMYQKIVKSVEEKFKDVKNDMKKIHGLSDFFIDIIENKDQYKDVDTKLLKDFLGFYLEYIPRKIKEFDFISMYGKLEKELDSNEFSYQLKLESKDNIKLKLLDDCEIAVKLINYIAKAIIGENIVKVDIHFIREENLGVCVATLSKEYGEVDKLFINAIKNISKNDKFNIKSYKVEHICEIQMKLFFNIKADI